MEEVTVSQSVSEENSLIKLKRYKKNVEWTNSLLETQQMFLYTKISVALSSFTRAKKKTKQLYALESSAFLEADPECCAQHGQDICSGQEMQTTNNCCKQTWCGVV